MATAASDMVPDGDPVIDRLRSDLDELEVAKEFLKYHNHGLAAALVQKEMMLISQQIGKWQALHSRRLPLTFGQKDLWEA